MDAAGDGADGFGGSRANVFTGTAADAEVFIKHGDAESSGFDGLPFAASFCAGAATNTAAIVYGSQGAVPVPSIGVADGTVGTDA